MELPEPLNKELFNIGDNAILVWHVLAAVIVISLILGLSVGLTGESNYNYVGCYRDSGDRAFKEHKGGKTLSECYNYAKNTGYKYFGLQNTGGTDRGECWFNKGRGYNTHGSHNNCRRVNNNMYGSNWSNAVYLAD